MSRVLVSGATGLIGAALSTALEAQGAQVVRLVRGQSHSPAEIAWNPMAKEPGAGPPSSMVSGFDAVVHLAGESIVGRWTEAKKRAIRDSRVRSTRNLATVLPWTESKPKVFVCASAIGFYGDRGEEILTEQSSSGGGFLAEVCREWEAASQIAAGGGIRTVNLRTGLVLSANGGALGKMLTPFKLGLGGRIGSGKQWWSWIHIDDMVGGILHALATESVVGPVNMVAPQTVRNDDFTKTLASVLGRPALFPVPRFALRLTFAKLAADELFLASQHVKPEKLTASGYRFQFPDLRAALESLV
ncbi:MAG TPA: TIGR01777 family oxidoreductase [Terriglobales bacterium]|nr:TIGR01777 family oxidoreductase [Terriglobales bacterium]